MHQPIDRLLDQPFRLPLQLVMEYISIYSWESCRASLSVDASTNPCWFRLSCTWASGSSNRLLPDESIARNAQPNLVTEPGDWSAAGEKVNKLSCSGTRGDRSDAPKGSQDWIGFSVQRVDTSHYRFEATRCR